MPLMPALLTRMSTRPNCASAAAARRLHLADHPVVGFKTQDVDAVASQFRLRPIEVFLLEIGDGHLRAATSEHARM
jgi:hypothetical protein